MEVGRNVVWPEAEELTSVERVTGAEETTESDDTGTRPHRRRRTDGSPCCATAKAGRMP